MEIGRTVQLDLTAAVSKLLEGFKILASGQEVNLGTIDHLVLWKIQTKTYTNSIYYKTKKKKKNVQAIIILLNV